MPVLNRRGPKGDGPMTGRRMGKCNPENKGKTDEEILQGQDKNPNRFGQGLGRKNGNNQGKGQGRGQAMRLRGNV